MKRSKTDLRAEEFRALLSNCVWCGQELDSETDQNRHMTARCLKSTDPVFIEVHKFGTQELRRTTKLTDQEIGFEVAKAISRREDKALRWLATVTINYGILVGRALVEAVAFMAYEPAGFEKDMIEGLPGKVACQAIQALRAKHLSEDEMVGDILSQPLELVANKVVNMGTIEVAQA